MSNDIHPLRPAMTAIAAVIALSSTSLLAQEADSAAAPVATAAPASAAPVVSIDVPLVPAASASAPVAAAAPAMRTIGTPVEHVEDAPAAAPTASAPRAVHKASARVAPVATKASRPVSTSAAITHKAAPAPVAAKPAPALAPEPKAAAPVVHNTTVTQRSSDNDLVPIAGAVGLGILAIGGAAVAFGRRRRDEEDFAGETTEERIEPVMAAPTAAPVLRESAAEPRPTLHPIMVPGTPRDLPAGFDLSRYGRHVQAAYRGPTPDNPSHSLRRRLKHARFFDQREREAIAAGQAPQPLREPVYAAAQAAAPQPDGQVTLRLAPQRSNNRFGYVLQK